MDIRGLVSGEGKVHQFGIDQLYIPLKTAGVAGRSFRKSDGKGRLHPDEGMMAGEMSLHEALQISLQETMKEAMHRCGLIIKGDPGAGKSTFLRLITFTLCKKWLGEESASSAAAKIIWPGQPPLPVFVRLGRLADHIHEWKAKDPAHSPTHKDSPEWLFHFLGEQSKEFDWQVSAEDFRREMKEGHCLIMLDGLDEAPNSRMRQNISSLVAHLLRAYPKCCLVLTSRPGALIGKVMPEGDFALAEIAPLDEQAMKVFLTQWSSALYPDAPEKSRQHLAELIGALQSSPQIRRMASTPVMLTALAVVHWNENRLPEQRAELYESVITWLLRAREQRPGRLSVDRSRKLLQKLALAMFIHPDGRQRQVGLRWAAEQLAAEFDSNREHTAVELAERFLGEEMLDSGIIVERSHRLEFWHLSFQEYLAAFEIAGLLEAKQLEILFENERLSSSEWREVVLLLSGVLYKQGLDKINHLIDEIITRGPQKGTNETLPQLARKVGLSGGIERDLAPYRYKPANPAYPEIMRQVMGIFDKAAYRNVPMQVRIEAADALAQAGDPRLAEGDPRTGPMIEIPGGLFWMGAQRDKRTERNFDKDARNDESPVHQVELSAYRIGKYPVTVEQYRRFIEDGGYENNRYWQATGGFGKYREPKKWEDQKQYPSRPVVSVSWYEAAAFACWAGGRLPTEAEWERAARGPGQEYRKYPWGSNEPTPETANFYESETGKAAPVGIFPDNCSPEGVIDMAGNVWEWCQDWYSEKYYQLCARQGVVKDPLGPKNGEGRVVRGGSFLSYQVNLRCAARYWSVPSSRVNYSGFRVVRGPSV
ncbi:MAG: SUMF1/EgtB/PvdO family nonheme iron enzyme [bacterium]